MGRSLLLALHLALAGRGRDAPAFAARPARPDGRLVWFHVTDEAARAPALQVIRRLTGDRGGVHALISAGSGRPAVQNLPPRTLADDVAADRLPAVRAALDHWSPQVLVLAGPGLPAALIAEASDRGIPLLLIEYRPPAQGYIGRGMTGSLLARFARILVLDHAAAERTLRLAPERSAPVAVGRIDEIAEPLPSTEAERSALAAIIGTRPVWLAAGVPEAEEEAVIAAQVQILRQMHRTLLILAPQESGRADDIAQRAAREGWGVALRAHDEDPGKDTQLLIADGSSELGMWYRLAPVTYLGGTLSGGATRSPLEAAALGSAVVAGPEHGAEAGRLARLAEARALSPVRDAAGLAGAVGELLAPDRAALLAHNAWMVTSGGSEVTERFAEAIVAELDRPQEATTAARAAGAAV